MLVPSKFTNMEDDAPKLVADVVDMINNLGAPSSAKDEVDKKVETEIFDMFVPSKFTIMEIDAPKILVDVIDNISNFATVSQKDAPNIVADAIDIINNLDAQIEYDSMHPIDGKVATVILSLNTVLYHHLFTTVL
jgi:hypothetical protein